MVREPPVGVGSHVEAWPQAEFAAAHHETVDDITTIGGVHHTVVGVLRIPEAEATLVMSGQADLAGPESNSGFYPLICGQVGGVELGGGYAVVGCPDAVVLDTGERVH